MVRSILVALATGLIAACASPVTSGQPGGGAHLSTSHSSAPLVAHSGPGEQGSGIATTATTAQGSPAPEIPPALGQPSLAYDSVRGVLVLFGGSGDPSVGYNNKTYTWDGHSWRRASTSGPPGRFGAAMVFDPIRQDTVLYGGWGDQSPTTNGPLGDTWTWDGRAWRQQHPVHNPPPRAFAAMTFDAARGVAVMFGGEGTTTTYSGTWTWDGADWTLQQPAHEPSPRRYAAMAYDAARQKAMLFGGSLPGARYDDTWVWDGSDWTQLHPTTSPAGRTLADMAFDPTTAKTVLFGGLDVGNYPMADTWTWDGQTWTQQAPSTSPSGRIGQGTAYDAAAGLLVIFGGVASTTTNETWAWDGSSWTQR